MNYTVSLLYELMAYSAVTFRTITATGLTSLTIDTFSIKLYQDLGNENAPSGKDLATVSAVHRARICKDLASTGLFDLGLIPIDLKEIHTQQNRKSYSDSSNDHSEGFSATNPYRLRKFIRRYSNGVVHTFKEYVFVCSLKDLFDGNLVPLYVSKEYNVYPMGQPYAAGRFIFGNLTPSPNPDFEMIMLAEEPARAHSEPGFNVELYYLRLKKQNSNYRPAVRNADDPLCKLISHDDPDNQHDRVCEAIFSSSYFVKKEIRRYPRPEAINCGVEKIAFRTDEAIEEAAGESYHERMTPCHFLYVDPSRGGCLMYLSRAYKSNQVFVYLRDSTDGKLYLENLSTNLKIVELTSFDFIED